jgi:5-oxoprolinase (ATP-hydrolysing) subunit B
VVQRRWADQPFGRLAIEPLFPLALGQVQLAPDPLDTAAQLQAIRSLRGAAASNPDPGCAWTGDLHGVWQLHRHPLFMPLIGELAGHAWSYLRGLGFDPARVSLHLQRCWPVLSEAGQVVGRHHHPNAHLSAVYYLNGDGSGRCGCLRLFPPRQVNELVPGLAVGHGGPLTPGHPLTAPCWDVAPRAGLLLLFPACTEHAVLENEDESDSRFSISIDFMLTAPPAGTGETPPEYLAPHPSQWDAVGEDGA